MITQLPDKLQLTDRNVPTLQSGTYKLKLSQSLNGTDFSKDLTFHVAGSQYTLNPADIVAVFPPPGSLGNYHHAVPNVVLKRSTLPWEREIADNDTNPWLALLLINESDESGNYEEKVINLSEFDSTLEPGQTVNDKITVIDVDKSLLETIMPKRADLQWLAHVKSGLKNNSPLEEYAVILGNRMPKKGTTSTVFLVSLENRFKADGEFDHHDTKHVIGGKIRLVTLKKWQFSTVDPQFDFVGVLTELSKYTIGGTARKLTSTQIADPTRINNYLATGHVPLEHQMRNGDRTMSWYHGPLVPGDMKVLGTILDNNSFHCTSDSLVIFDTRTKLFNTAYAAAWELGRNIAFGDKEFAVKFYEYKRCCYQGGKQCTDDIDHLPFETCSHELPAYIKEWFSQLKLLHRIPFNYLIPENELLPPESIRFFKLDKAWMDALLDGAYSVGRYSEAENHRDAEAKKCCDLKYANFTKNISGFLLRSEVVSGYPGLLIDGYSVENPSDIDAELTILRQELVGDDVLLCLFDTDPTSDTDPALELKTVDIYQKPQLLHFGFDYNEDKEEYKKDVKLKNDGTLLSTDVEVPLPNTELFRDAVKKVVNMVSLSNKIVNQVFDITSLTPASFAIHMTEGAEKVRFVN